MNVTAMSLLPGFNMSYVPDGWRPAGSTWGKAWQSADHRHGGWMWSFSADDLSGEVTPHLVLASITVR